MFLPMPRSKYVSIITLVHITTPVNLFISISRFAYESASSKLDIELFLSPYCPHGSLIKFVRTESDGGCLSACIYKPILFCDQVTSDYVWMQITVYHTPFINIVLNVRVKVNNSDVVFLQILITLYFAELLSPGIWHLNNRSALLPLHYCDVIMGAIAS